jgi:hypothetical protein
VNSCAASKSGFITRCYEREVAVLCIVDFLKMSKQSPLESFDTELFINEIQPKKETEHTTSGAKTV